MARTLDGIHTTLSYVQSSLQNATIVRNGEKFDGFIFSLLNPPVPLGGNIVSFDIYVDEIPMPRSVTFIATNEDMVSASAVTDERPLAFKPYQSARFLVLKEKGLDENKRHTLSIMSKLQGFEQVVIPFRFSDRVTRRQGVVILDSSLHDAIQTDEATNFRNF